MRNFLVCFGLLQSACVGFQVDSEHPCNGISDESVIAAFAPLRVREDWTWKNPVGPSYEYWEDTCVQSLDEFFEMYPPRSYERVLRSEEHREFFEANYGAGSPYPFETHRAPRCEYFDGETLGGGPFRNANALDELTSLLDVVNHRHAPAVHGFDESRHGRTTLTRAAHCDDRGCTVNRCVAYHPTIGCGSCDQYYLSVESDRLNFDGHVELGTPTEVRTVGVPSGPMGTCDETGPHVCLP